MQIATSAVARDDKVLFVFTFCLGAFFRRCFWPVFLGALVASSPVCLSLIALSITSLSVCLSAGEYGTFMAAMSGGSVVVVVRDVRDLNCPRMSTCGHLT